MKYELPQLKYSYNALEPFIDEATMSIHHSKHHAAYINNLNAALEKYPEFQKLALDELLKSLDSLPEDIRSAIRNNGGGHYNHSFFWSILSPDSKREPEGELAVKISEVFGSYEVFKDEFAKAAAARFGSGWAWLVLDREGKLKVVSTANQDNPVSEGLRPILGLDVWEHAYYLKYQNRRPEYVSQWWNVVDWDEVSNLYQKYK